MSKTNISIIDVGHGNSSILFDGNETVIIDCGARGASLLQYLEDRGITKVKTIFLSHSDQDHIGGLIAVLSSGMFDIDAIYLNSDASKESKLWDDLAYLLDNSDRKGITKFEVAISDGLPSFFAGEIELSVTGPSKYLVAKGAGGKDLVKRTITSNSLSASFLIKYKGAQLVFLSGDIDQIGLDELVRTGKDIKAKVLVFPHHGGRPDDANVTTFTEKIFDMVLPNSVIFSTGRNKFDNPRPEVVKALRLKGAEVRISCTQLSRSCAATLPTEAPPHLHPFYAKGKPQKECCGGTYVLELDDNVRELPDLSSHQDFISKHAITAICRS